MHYANSIEMFGSPNGTCSSQTEAKHIQVVKEPWRRSNRKNPLPQMLQTINRMDKLAAIRSVFRDRGMLSGSIIEHMVCQSFGDLPPALPWNRTVTDGNESSGYDDNNSMDDGGAAHGPQMETITWLAARHRKFPKSLTI
jgi:hypothetical protein